MASHLSKYNRETLQEKVDEYFEVMDKTGRPYTMSGLAYFLGTNRMTLLNYRNKDKDFGDVIQGARDRIEAFVEEQLFSNPRQAGVIFNLKNNFRNWSDKNELTVTANTSNPLAELSTNEIKQLLQSQEEEEENEVLVIE